MKLAKLHRTAHLEPYWHVQLAVLLAIFLQLFLNKKLTIGPKYLVAGFECLLLVALTLFDTQRHKFIIHVRRSLAIVLVALISLANIISLILVIDELFGGRQVTGTQLLISALSIYITNIIIFGLWYWELDDNTSGGNTIDFLFPQATSKDEVPGLADWQPTFFDYLYVSITNASAFSPTDTLPLTHRAKLLMGLQSAISLITVALVAARAVNILA